MKTAVVDAGGGLMKRLGAGSAVVSRGWDSGGTDSVAVWRLDPIGAPDGAWVEPVENLFRDRLEVRELLTKIQRRAIATVDQEAASCLLGTLSDAAEIETERWWSAQLFSPLTVFEEILAQRRKYSVTVERMARHNGALATLEWAHDLTVEDCPRTFTELRRISGVRLLTGSPVGVGTLMVARVLRWLESMWNETEQVKNRIRQVRAVHGPPEVLPPSWLTAMRNAGAVRLPL